MASRDDNTPENPVQWRVAGPGYIPEVEVSLTGKIPAGVYRVAPIGFQWGIVPLTLTTDALVKEGHAACDLVVKEIRRFWQRSAQYAEMGFSHKRGFLLHGPPGTGKTSTAALVAQELVEQDGLVFVNNETQALVAMFERLRKIEADRKLGVIHEDLENHYENDGETLLSFLDGENSVAGVVHIATTNFVGKLDARIIDRPSRFDRVIYVGSPTAEYRAAYLKSRNVKLPPAELHKWVVDSEGFSVAHLKELIIGVFLYEDKYEDVLERVKAMGKPGALMKHIMSDPGDSEKVA